MSSLGLELPGVDRRPQRPRVGLRPWGDKLVLRLLLGNVVALVLIGLGWYGSSGKTTVGEQLSWLNIGLLGIGVSGLVNGSWLLRGHRAVRSARSYVFPSSQSAAAAAAAGAGADAPSLALVSGAEMTRFHRADCPLAVGKPTSPGTYAGFVHANRVPCENCRPSP